MTEEDDEFKKAFNEVFKKDRSNFNSEENNSIKNSEMNYRNSFITQSINNNPTIKTESNKVLFSAKKKRGKNSSNNNGKYHSANDNDNIRTKIQVHYLNFIVSFFNDIIYESLGIKEYFLKFAYSEKRKINNKNDKYIKQLTIGEIFEKLKTSSKYTRKIDSKTRKEKLNFLREYAQINDLLDINYLEFFYVYYNDNKPLDYYKIDEEKIIFIREAKSFTYLKKKFFQFRNELDGIVKMDYLDKINFSI